MRFLLTLLIILVIFLGFLGFWQLREKKSVTYEGYIFTAPEALYFISGSLSNPDDSKEKIWVEYEDNTLEEKVKNLNWIDHSQYLRYSKIRIEGVLKGSGRYGHLGKYFYEIKARNIEQIK